MVRYPFGAAVSTGGFLLAAYAYVARDAQNLTPDQRRGGHPVPQLAVRYLATLHIAAIDE